MQKSDIIEHTACMHCGEACDTGKIQLGDKIFCCEGCKMVYQLLDNYGLCEYYDLNKNPGFAQLKPTRKNKYAFLDDENIIRQLIHFSEGEQEHVTLYLPQIHCSSCLYLLENLNKLNTGVISCQVNFPRKELTLIYNNKHVTLRRIAELLTSVGYEPYISLNDLKGHKPTVDRSLLYQLGIAGFCFANIMLLSFPEYLGLDEGDEQLGKIFRILNVILALPVFFYSARPFFESGYKALRHKFLNIDAPIALAILVTFGRSLYEIIGGTGAGYLDSMAGIVFFMLIGRVLQEKTYAHLSFERDYSSYFPVAVSVIKEDTEIPTSLPDLKNGDTLRIHNEELIPADGIITRGKAFIDYSFVTGESIPVSKEMGEIVYAGGRQTGGMIEVLVIKEVSQSYLTGLWSGNESKADDELNKKSFIHILSRYFTVIVLSIAASAAIYWGFNDVSKIFPSVTAVLIIACPCALLLSSTFTNGHILNILGRNKLYIRNADVIEEISKISHIVFDKTGTLTETSRHEVEYSGEPVPDNLLIDIAAILGQSTHPLSKAIHTFLGLKTTSHHIENFEELPGRGLIGTIEGRTYRLGSAEFTGSVEKHNSGSYVFVRIDEKLYGRFHIHNHYRKTVPRLIRSLSSRYTISIISGDNPSERQALQKLGGKNINLFFNQQPEDKLRYIQTLQANGARVLMIGDGLNDAGALRQSDAGIALTENSNNFTPASDGIMEAGSLEKLPGFIKICIANRHIIIASFILSILYNIVGISFAVQGTLSPIIAAILMPASSISIMLLTYGASVVTAKRELSSIKN